MTRTLRSQRKRAFLHWKAEGICEICGDPLADNWEADHIIPWKTTQRTNIFEMQATCKKCNRAKGAKQMTPEDNQLPYNLEPARPGQLYGIQQCLDNFHNREPYTPIILPTRYGKSDLIRLSAIIAWARGYISLAIVLSPNATLRDQIFSKEKFNQMTNRYSLNIPGVKYRTITTYKDYKNLIANREMMLSITIQLAKDMKIVLLDLIDHMNYQTGSPVAVYIDETQLMSTDNTWGDFIIDCQKAGAISQYFT